MIDWRERAVGMQATINELEDQIHSMLRTEFKMFESQRKLERYLSRVEKFNNFSLEASKSNSVYELMLHTLKFCLEVYQFQEGHVSFIGEFESFSLLAEGDVVASDDPLMMDIRHGKVDYSSKVQLFDIHSSSHEIKELKDVFNLDISRESAYILFHFKHGSSSYSSLVFKTKDVLQQGKLNELPSRDDLPLFLALHQMIQSELSNKILRCELENKISERTRESERSNTMLRKSLLILQEVQSDLIQSGKLASIGEISSSIAHEINNPLFIIQGRLSSMQKMIDCNKYDAKKFSSYIVNMQQMQDRIQQIVRGLRSFSRDSRLMDDEDFEAAEIISEINVFLGERLKKGGVEFIVKDETQGQKLRAKKVEVSQVFINLITNAIEAIKDNEEKWIEVDIKKVDDEFVIRVTDSGYLKRNQAVKFFKPFYSSKLHGSGTGLGLSISRRIVERYQGTLTIDLEAKNTSFIVTFKVAG